MYKESAACRLADISNRLTEQFGAKFGADKIQLLPNKPVPTPTPSHLHCPSTRPTRSNPITDPARVKRGQVERDSLDKSRVYIQIVEVTPYFTPEELLIRKTPFSRSFDLSTPVHTTPSPPPILSRSCSLRSRFRRTARFMYETPFVKEGKKMGSMEVHTTLNWFINQVIIVINHRPHTAHAHAHDMTQDQYKRQTIVKTSHAFPSMHKRVPIVSKEEVRTAPLPNVDEVSGTVATDWFEQTTTQIILSPIETARDLIRGRSEALQKELSSTSPNTKTLQIVLQGSVLLRTDSRMSCVVCRARVMCVSRVLCL